jgi:hypothetical protein
MLTFENPSQLKVAKGCPLKTCFRTSLLLLNSPDESSHNPSLLKIAVHIRQEKRIAVHNCILTYT